MINLIYGYFLYSKTYNASKFGKYIDYYFKYRHLQVSNIKCRHYFVFLLDIVSIFSLFNVSSDTTIKLWQQFCFKMIPTNIVNKQACVNVILGNLAAGNTFVITPFHINLISITWISRFTKNRIHVIY